MYIWFFICVFSMFLAILLHLKSIERLKLRQKHGERTGDKVGKIYGVISGTMEFIFLIGLWVSPQPRFVSGIFLEVNFALFPFLISVFYLVISLPLIILGAWIALRGVYAISLEVAETHSIPKNLESTGVYSIVRHPQYFGWILTHVGFSIALSGLFSILFTPILVVLIYLISKKEEEDLIMEFGENYRKYKTKVPMLFPSICQLVWNAKRGKGFKL